MYVVPAGYNRLIVAAARESLLRGHSHRFGAGDQYDHVR